MITWEQSDLTGICYGSTKEDLENDDLARYQIENCTLKYCESGMNFVRIRCISVDEAKQLTEIIERGRVAP